MPKCKRCYNDRLLFDCSDSNKYSIAAYYYCNQCGYRTAERITKERLLLLIELDRIIEDSEF